jgi:hypothetical protein
MTDEKTRKWLSWCIVIMLIVISTVFGVKLPAIPAPPLEALGYTHFSGLVVTAPTTVATATPGSVINSLGLGNILEIQDASTPVVQVNASGNTQISRLLNYNCSYVEAAASANSGLTPANSCYIVSVGTGKNLDYTLTATGMVTGTLLHFTQIGAGTLVISDTILISSDGNALSMGPNDSVLLIFDGTNWNGLIKLAGS